MSAIFKERNPLCLGRPNCGKTEVQLTHNALLGSKSVVGAEANDTFAETGLAPCPACGSRLFRKKYGPIKQCSDCGLGVVNPRGEFPGENETEEYFLHDYLPLHLASREASMAERRSHIATILHYFELPAAPRILDVGCALGFMLEEAKAAGWNPVGVETSEFAARYAAQHTGCPVHAGTLQKAALPSESFDVVTLMDVVEHVPEPFALLSEIYRILRQGGVLFILTPNFGSAFVRLFGLNAYGVWPDQHVVYFQFSSMTRLLRRVGFRRVAVGTKDFYADNLRRLLRRNRVQSAEIKNAFAKRAALDKVRHSVNRILMHVHLGDKLIAIAQK
jgi:2-polyprenyl-3-methyl-5-hydroxy-6-metoxy-1,4-benzoquinol methylase